MSNNIITKHNFFGKYKYEGVYGKQEGETYLIDKQKFIGNSIDQHKCWKNISFIIMGNLAPGNLNFLKLPKDSNILPIYWYLNKKDNEFFGDFYLSSIPYKDDLYKSLLENLEFLKSGNKISLDDNLLNYFEKINSFEKFVEKGQAPNGSGIVTLTKVN